MGDPVNDTLLLVGLGHLGGIILELVARDHTFTRIVAATRHVERGRARVNLARVGVATEGRAPVLEFAPLDVNDAAAVAALVDRVRPGVILSTATMQTWWLAELLPEAEAAALGRARFGAWLPVHLAPTLKLMTALAKAGYRGVTLTAPYPDVVNCVLGRRGLAPTCGIGNLDEIEPKVRLLAAERLGVGPAEVTVTLVAHHALERFVYAGAEGEPPPYFLRVECEGRDVTREVDAGRLLFAPYPLPPTPAWHFLTAASTVRLVRALASERPVRLHAPAPRGLPGGYPVLVSRDGVTPAPIDGLSLDEAVAINERAQRWDGVERIEPDGTVVVCDEDARVMRDVLGYDGARIAPDDAEARAQELVARFREYARRAGVDIDRLSGRVRL
jgi:hypothetical protein